ncbi:MAG TPA: nucleoside hydrolase [Candidatus Gallimonas intestinigallinarum]|uniref:Nucleoside hydrolase n=1 Tax=Candidatus Gallimonas intestinigallinarum TaxID=2838604 RepID=A0A9D2DWD8_9FIRM|nr:nucleoside hydrolase [Candidatus Gallimonas intestinigallinarum]
MKKVIFDTDIGDDIDDAFALAALLAEPAAQLAGVTTVYRNTVQRAQLAAAMLYAAGASDVPVYAGENIPIKEPIRPFAWEDDRELEKKRVCQWSEEYAAYPVRTGAAEFLAESAERFGAELTVFAVGPLTNLAQAIRRYPASMKKIGEIRTMGGSFASVRPEWNILCDPEAADTVYSSGIPVYAVGLDVTMRCSLDETLLSRVAASPRATNKLLSLWYGRWSEHFRFPKSVMHDPLAVASAFTQVCRFEKPFVRADLKETRGAMLCRSTPQAGYSPVNVAEDVDRDAFYAWLEERLGCKG